MVTRAFMIAFDYRLDHGNILISLRAEVEVHDNPFFYLVRNIRPPKVGNSRAIPDVRLVKKDSVWVHCDSEKPTELALSIGGAIDAHNVG